MRRRVTGNAGRWAGCGRCQPAQALGVAGAVLLVAGIASVSSPVRADDCSGGATTARVSVGNSGAEANGRSELAAVNADGCVVAFKSVASNLIANDGNGLVDVFVRDRKAGTTERIPVKPYVGPDPNAISYPPALDADGGIVIFGSEASNLVSGDFNASPDLFAYDRTLDLTSILSLVLDVNGQGRGGGRVPDLPPSVCADGSLAAFTSSAADLVSGDDNGANDVFVRDRIAGTIELISVTPVGGGGHSANGPSAGGAISADGCTVAFYSDATNLVPDDTNEARDVFARNRCAGTTERVSVASGGAQANGPSQLAGGLPGISADGRYVVFASDASNLVAGDTNGVTDVFWRDRQTGTTTLISKNANGDLGNGPSQFPSVSADGRFVAFQSAASNLVDGDTNGASDIFVVDTSSGSVRRVSVAGDGGEANGASSQPQISTDGTTVVYQSTATNLVAGDMNGVSDIFASVNPLVQGPTASPASATATATATTTPTATAMASPSPTPTVTGSVTPTATTTQTGTVSTTATATPTATLTSGTATVAPTATATPNPSATLTAPATRTVTGAPPTPTAKIPGGGGSGGCSCRIDGGSGRPADSGLLPACAVPALLWGLRRRRRDGRRANAS